MRFTRVGLVATALCLLAATPAAAAPGAPDPSFGKGGVVRSSYGAFDAAYAITGLPDGSVVVGGASSRGWSNAAPGTFLLAKHLPNGRLDPKFGKGGVVRTAIAGGGAHVLEMLQYSDGRLLAAGMTRGGSVDGVALARYLPDGRLDRTFSDDGIALAPVRSKPVVVTGAAFLPDGAIVVCGTIRHGFNAVSPFVQRFLADGRLDTSFGDGGTIFPSIGTGNEPWKMPTDLAVMPDLSLVLVGWSWSESAGDNPFLARVLPTGMVDPVFGASVPTDFGGGDFETVERTVDGLVLVGGAAPRPGSAALAGVVARFLPTGTLDPSFGTGGVAATTAAVDRRIFDIVPVSGGRLVAVGGSVGRNHLDSLVWRLTPLGASDPAFGTNGVTARALAPGMDVAWVGVAGPGDTVTTAGASWPADQSRRDTVVARFLG